MLDRQKTKLSKAVTVTKGPFFRIAVPAISLRWKTEPANGPKTDDTRITKDEIINLFDADLQNL